MKIAVIAGTGDATELIQTISEMHEITAFVATDYGREILKHCHCDIQVGRLQEQEFLQKLINFNCVIDASHPFAKEVTKTVKAVCEKLNILYLRLIRPESDFNYDNIQIVNSKEEACQLLSGMTGNILFTTGVNTLHFYENHVKNFTSRAWVRILDTEESHKIAQNLDAQIIYALPPFTEQDTLAILQKYHISVLVSKDSGARGGLREKINAAKKNNIPVILLKRPEETGMQIQEISDYLSSLEESLC